MNLWNKIWILFSGAEILGQHFLATPQNAFVSYVSKVHFWHPLNANYAIMFILMILRGKAFDLCNFAE